MAMAEAISLGALIFIICLQNSFAQQCVTNQVSQQAFQRSNYGPNQIPQNGINFSPLQKENLYQTNDQQQTNIQQALPTQLVNNQQTPIDYLQGYFQQPANSVDNSEVKKQQSQDLASKIFSTLYNIQQSSQNQRNTNAKGNPSQQVNYEKQLSQNQLNSAFTVSTPINQGQNSQNSVTNSYSDTTKFQPTFTFQVVPSSNIPVQQTQPLFTVPVHKVSTNDQSQSNSPQSQSGQNQQVPSIVMIPSTETNNVQSQPIVLSFQSSQMPSSHNQPTLLTSQSNEVHPVIYTAQNSPSSSVYQNQHNSEVLSQTGGSNNLPTDVDKKSLVSYILSQTPNSYNSGNTLASILPGMLNSKPDKSLSMKTLLPLIFSILNDKKGCCECPHCGCNHDHNHNNVDKLAPLINTGYSNQINYSRQKPVDLSIDVLTDPEGKGNTTNNDTKQNKSKEDEVINNSEEISEEDDEGYNSEEEYDEE